MNDTCKQLTKFFLCTILLIAAFPFIGLAAIFSIFMDIPHIKIELGADNVVETVFIGMQRKKAVVEDSDTESESDNESEDSGNDGGDEADEPFIELSVKLSKYLFNEDSEIITTFDVLKQKINRDIEEKGPFDGKGGINYYPELWRFLELSDEYKLTVDKLWNLLKNEYTEFEKKTEEEIKVKEENITGRVGGFEDNFPVTPARSSRSHSPPGAPQRKPRNSSILDTGVLIEKLRATTELNDGDNLTPTPSESSEQADGAQTPSECPPSSS